MKKLVLRILITILSIQTLLLTSPSTAYAQEETCPPPTMVTINVKPGDDLNRINLSSRASLPVAVLTTDDFDASQFAPEMAHLHDASTGMGCEGAEAVRWIYADANGDGRLDLLFFFRVQDINLTANSTGVMLMAHGLYDSTMIHIEGTDFVVIIP